MKTTNLLGWVGIALALASASCSKSVEGFCESWVEETCKALTTCCESGDKYDEDACRLELSKTCQDALDVEQIHAGERVFNAGAASDCFPSIKTCADIGALSSSSQNFEREVACANMVTGFRPPGAACDSDKDCQIAGEMAYCYEPGSTGVCVEVIVDEAKCSFSFDTNELRVCPEGKYCDLADYEPSDTAAPTSREYEFASTCKPNVGNGGKCVSDKGNPLPCATGLYCDFLAGNDATCKKRKSAGATCDSSFECAVGLSCDSNPNGPGETCQDASAPFCWAPPKCGDGDCNGNEDAASCPMDCGGGGSCGDGFCDSDIGEQVTCPDDCCGDGFCDPGESAVCADDCGGGI